MDFLAIALLAAVRFHFGICGFFEMTVWRCCILKAMAGQYSGTALQQRLRAKDDHTTSSRELKLLENLCVFPLNRYLLQWSRIDNAALRRGILNSENSEL